MGEKAAVSLEVSLSHEAIAGPPLKKDVVIGSLRQRLWHAGGWSVLSHASTQLIRLAGNVLLARFLMPEAFALSTVVMLLTVGLTLFSDLGVFQNVVRHPDAENRRFLDTAWSVQVLRGVVIWLVALGVAACLPWLVRAGWVRADTVYADPRLPWMIAVATFSAVFQGFESTQVLVERRHMRLKRLTQIELASQVVASVLMVTVAWFTRSVWAFVVGGLCAAALRCIWTHRVLGGPANRWAWDAHVLRDLVGFGKWVFLSSVLFYLVSNSDRLILSNLIDSTTFGLYSIGFLLATAPGLVMNTLAGSVALPTLSEVIRERPHDLVRVLAEFQRLSDGFLGPMVGLLWSLGPFIVGFFYDARYQPAGAILSSLAWGVAANRYVVLEQCYLAMGQPQMLTLVNAVRFLCAFIGIPLAFQFAGFEGALAVIVLTQYTGWPFAVYFKIRNKLFDWRTELLSIPWLALGLMIGSMTNFMLKTLGWGAA
jgi:O-antigen/teichoic acid export membrane protein